MSAYAERALIVTFPPVPLFTGAGHFGLLISFGGLSFDRAPLYYRPTGAFFQQNCKLLLANVHRLVPAYLFGAAVVSRTSCHSYARVGGVISTAYLPNFNPVGASVPEARRVFHSGFARRMNVPKKTGGRPP